MKQYLISARERRDIIALLKFAQYYGGTLEILKSKKPVEVVAVGNVEYDAGVKINNKYLEDKLIPICGKKVKIILEEIE